ncbi:hypothetical protein [Robiginitalea aurantiaca]|uniref:DUF748 domain-containing protein n=1 Tax=Robiginitalea aurantiaca TaxID=3056915 RepID=A0ABT7WE13_9FLAO|nr:hypothetical protein [Robiginitalea aurantiaca]MDM9631159.1 hypothetical protein [Robiginitalea aurantiaca]
MKKKYKILFGIFLLVIALVFLLGKGMINPILENSLDAYLKDKLEVRWATPTYRFSYDQLDIDILSERITFRDFRMTPLEEYREVFYSDTLAGKALREIKADEITVKGVGLMNFLWDKNIQIDEIDINKVSFDLVVAPKSKKKVKKDTVPKGPAIEGIRLPGINKLSLGRFDLGSFILHQIHKDTKDTLLTFNSSGGALSGMSLIKPEGDDDSFFEPNLKELVLQLDQQVLDLKKELYQTSIAELEYSYASENLEIKGITFQPREDRDAFRKKARYSYEIYDATVKRLFLEDFDLEGYLNEGIVFVKKMELDSLNLEIYRDKAKPYDTSRKVLFLNQKMVALNFPLRVGSIEIKDSYLKYTEQSEGDNAPLVVDFSDLNLQLTNLTSITEGLEDSEAITMDLQAKLDKSIPIGVKIELPYHGRTFHVSGYTEGASNFSSLNNTVLPATGLKFTSGRLDGLRFDITGTPRTLTGELTLLYHGLEVELAKPDDTKRKTLSWAANTLLKSENPNKNGRIKVGEIEFERIPYKGLGNYVWKGVASGLVNSVSPVGKHKVIKPAN